MSIVKNTPNFLKHSDKGWTTVLNSTIESIKDPATLGIYIYLSSKSENWEISITNLKNRFDRGGDFIKARLAELKKIGLLKSVAIKNEKGQISHWESILFNVPQAVDSKSIESKNQKGENPPCGESTHLVDPPTTKERLKKIKDINLLNPYVDLQSTEDENEKLFDDWYKIYPNKQKPHVARKAFHKLNPTIEFVEMLIDDVNKRIKNNWLGRDKSKIPHPSTYLNQREWEGEIYTPASQDRTVYTKTPSGTDKFNEMMRQAQRKHGVTYDHV